MEKLELKHLVNYLPYGLKARISIPFFDNKTIVEIVGLSENHAELVGIRKTATEHFEFNDIKPILRPLSDLTKEIEVNNEKFVPIERLFELSYDANKSKEYYYEKQINYIRCSHNDTVRHKMIFTNSEQFNRNLYLDVEKLHQWHFDTNGLIEKGLAIDFNTL